MIHPEICDLAPDVELRLFGPSADVILTTDTSGVATFDGAGRYQIEAVTEIEDRDFCGFQTQSGEITELLTLSTTSTRSHSKPSTATPEPDGRRPDRSGGTSRYPQAHVANWKPSKNPAPRRSVWLGAIEEVYPTVAAC